MHIFNNVCLNYNISDIIVKYVVVNVLIFLYLNLHFMSLSILSEKHKWEHVFLIIIIIISKMAECTLLLIKISRFISKTKQDME